MGRYLMKFFFHNSVHPGSDFPGIGEESSQSFIRSDTLFSAICNVWVQIDWYLKKQGCKPFSEMLKMFKDGKPPFKVSSCLPFYGDDLYFPKPAIEPDILYNPGNQRTQLVKKVKKIKYLKTEFFKAWLTNDDKYRGMAGTITDADENYNRTYFGKEVIDPKTPLSRLDNESNIYHSGNYFFLRESGLFSIIELDESKISESHFKILLTHLENYGLGGNRNIGQGAIKTLTFSSVPSEIEELFDIKSKLGYCLISLYYPESIDITNKVSVYELVIRKGWIGSTSANNSLKKKTCYMFSEGSMFSDIDNGKLLDVKPSLYTEHDVWRYGYAMTIPAKAGGNGNA